jgi:hypothetical protein
VLFADGTEEAIDVIVYATGFKLTFPFVDRAHLNWTDGRPKLYLNIFHPDYDNLFVIGMFQTSTGNWPLFHHQSELMAKFVRAARDHTRSADWLRRRKQGPSPNVSGGIRFTGVARHLLECEHFAYRAVLKKHAARFEAGMGLRRLAAWLGGRRRRVVETSDVPRHGEAAAAPRVQ